jgi:hypothetical protein
MNDESIVEARKLVDTFLKKLTKIAFVISLFGFSSILVGYVIFPSRVFDLAQIFLIVYTLIFGGYLGVSWLSRIFHKELETSEERKERLKLKEERMEIAKEIGQ